MEFFYIIGHSLGLKFYLLLDSSPRCEEKRSAAPAGWRHGCCFGASAALRLWPVGHGADRSSTNPSLPKVRSRVCSGLSHANYIQVLGLSFSPRTDSLYLMVRQHISASTISRQGYSTSGVTSNPCGPSVQRIASSSACFAWCSTASYDF